MGAARATVRSSEFLLRRYAPRAGGQVINDPVGGPGAKSRLESHSQMTAAIIARRWAVRPGLWRTCCEVLTAVRRRFRLALQGDDAEVPLPSPTQGLVRAVARPVAGHRRRSPHAVASSTTYHCTQSHERHVPSGSTVHCGQSVNESVIELLSPRSRDDNQDSNRVSKCGQQTTQPGPDHDLRRFRVRAPGGPPFKGILGRRTECEPETNQKRTTYSPAPISGSSASAKSMVVSAPGRGSSPSWSTAGCVRAGPRCGGCRSPRHRDGRRRSCGRRDCSPRDSQPGRAPDPTSAKLAVGRALPRRGGREFACGHRLVGEPGEGDAGWVDRGRRRRTMVRASP